MSYRESDIKYEIGDYFVLDTGNTYEVLILTNSYSVTDSAYERDSNGLSIAIARCNYLNKRNTR